MPEPIESVLAQARKGCAFHRYADREMLCVRGDRRLEFLQGQCTNDVDTLAEGNVCAAAFLNVKGRMLFEGRLLALSDAILMSASPGTAASQLSRLGMISGLEDCAIENVTDGWTILVVVGPEAGRCVSSALGEKAVPETPGRSGISGETVRVIAAPELGGFEIWCSSSADDDVEASLAHSDAVVLDDADFDLWRLECGVPAWGRDMGGESIPTETLLDDHVSYTKGCYVGQEIIARLNAYGSVSRRLVGLVTDAAVSPGEPVFGAGVKKLGEVTSAAHSPTLGQEIALAMVRKGNWDVGHELRIGDGEVRAVVTELPFVPLS